MAKASEKENTGLVVHDQGSMEDRVAIFGEDTGLLDGIELRLAQIKIAHQNQRYQMPDGSMTADFDGIMLDIVNVNAYWEKAFTESGGNEPPQCFSMDGVKLSPLSEKPQSDSGLCSECPQNKFGSDGGRGKACKNMKRVHVIIANEVFPKRLTVPPSSLEAFNIYGSLLADQKKPYQGVVTNFGLKEAKNKDGIKYSEIVLKEKGLSVDTREEFQKILNKRKEFLPAMRGDAIQQDEITSVA